MRIQSRNKYDSDLDPYFTPVEAVKSLICIEKLPRNLYEPAAGNGAIVKPLRKAGYVVQASDIAYYGFNCKRADYFSFDISVEGIVTNPPFKLAMEFAEKAVSEAPYVAFLLRTNFLESVKRMEFFKAYPPVRIWISSRRLPMMHRHGWKGNKAPSNTCHAWFIWDGFSKSTKVNWFDWKDYD